MIFAENILKGRVAVVTGGGTGIGKNIAVDFAKLGAKIAIASRRQENVDEGIKETAEYGKCIGMKADLRNFNEVEAFAKKAIDEYGRVDFLVNNAGGQFLSAVEGISPNGFDAVVKTNLYNTFYCCKAFGEHMKRQNYGKIINIVTIYALNAAPMMVHSGASRAGVVNLTKSLALEWSKYRINVNAIAPGFVDTHGFREELLQKKELLEKTKSSVPLGRLATAQEISDAAVYLASPAGDYITGQMLVIDGGAMLGNWPTFLWE